MIMLPLLTINFGRQDKSLSTKLDCCSGQLPDLKLVEQCSERPSFYFIIHALVIALGYIFAWTLFGLKGFVVGALAFSVVCAMIFVAMIYCSDIPCCEG
jgi:hypothetical protein